MRTAIVINLALDSIIYAPLYVAVRKSQYDPTSEFVFYLRCPRGSIDPAPGTPRVALAPTIDDPVFSPVITGDDRDIRPPVWFAVGDPLRVRRLVEHDERKKDYYNFLGTLVERLAFWVISEDKVPINSGKPLPRFNYLGCHSRGMTGYHLAERLLSISPTYNPLAPAQAGDEVDQFAQMLTVDSRRTTAMGLKRSGDHFLFAALTTELGHINYHKDRFRRNGATNGCRFAHCHISEIHNEIMFKGKFVMTAIVARRFPNDPSRQTRVERATNQLREHLDQALAELAANEPHAFTSQLEEFYRDYPSFRRPTGGGNKRALLSDIVQKLKGREHALLSDAVRELKAREIYAKGGLRTTADAREQTDALLRLSVASDIRSSRPTATDDEIATQAAALTTDTWTSSENLWS